MKKTTRIIENLTCHVVDTTAILTECTPLFAACETGIAGMSTDVSTNTRLLAVTLGYLGLGWAFAKGRDISRGIFNIASKAKERVQYLHDTLYGATFNALLSPPVYLAAGARDLDEIVIGAACSVGVGALNGGPVGYSVDVFRDLTGLKSCERTSYPNFVRRQSSPMKKTLALGLVTGSLALTNWIYS